MISPLWITALKFGFLAVLYLFVYRVARTATAGVRKPRPPRAGRPKPKRPPRSGRQPAVVIVRSSAGKKIGARRLRDSMSIGRDYSCDLKPDDSFISKFHARLFERDGTWLVEDLGSTNGTYLNGQRISRAAEIHAGDELRVGQTVLVLRR